MDGESLTAGGGGRWLSASKRAMYPLFWSISPLHQQHRTFNLILMRMRDDHLLPAALAI